jgi:hypothetical protein
MQSIEVAQGICLVMASKPGQSRLYKNKMMATTVILEINLVSTWSPPHST